MPIETPMLWLALALAILSFVAIFLLLGSLRNQQAKTSQLQAQVSELSQQLQTQTQTEPNQLEHEVHEIRAGALALGRRIQAVEARLDEVAEQQPNPDDLDPERRIYSRAVRMVELGADLEEIMRECELPRAEAELLFSLHQSKSS